ncbi:helix-turn-helix domain-containing protein [Leptospira bouyouniensis]|uniref:helix-turn-helix domain-containing protein n=1 Tax=Leptospira bouyouniensis TaxID=2484911 RepID=UPI00143861CE|nr:helix-turn-helix transcriptional regulator [Leptospira bouyouniensis]
MGEKLKELRSLSKMSINEISNSLAISKTYLMDLEHNRKLPSSDLLNRMSNFFEVDKNQFLELAVASRPFINLNIDPDNKNKLDTAVLLLREWDSMSEEKFKEIQNIINKKEL